MRNGIQHRYKMEDLLFYRSYYVFQVKFMEEDGVDEGGVSQEFFSLLSEALIAKDTTPLELFEESGLVWFMSDVSLYDYNKKEE